MTMVPETPSREITGEAEIRSSEERHGIWERISSKIRMTSFQIGLACGLIGTASRSELIDVRKEAQDAEQEEEVPVEIAPNLLKGEMDRLMELAKKLEARATALGPKAIYALKQTYRKNSEILSLAELILQYNALRLGEFFKIGEDLLTQELQPDSAGGRVIELYNRHLEELSSFIPQISRALLEGNERTWLLLEMEIKKFIRKDTEEPS